MTGVGDWVSLAGTVLAVLLAVGWYLSYTAIRLDRLHHRLVGTAAGLDAQLVRRGEATIELGLGGVLDPATATLLISAAGECLDQPGEWTPERAAVETELTEVLRAADPVLRSGDEPGGADFDSAELVERLRGAGLRVQYARSFHNEAVAETRSLHQEPIVRWFHLMGHTPTPSEVCFDDEWPAAQQ